MHTLVTGGGEGSKLDWAVRGGMQSMTANDGGDDDDALSECSECALHGRALGTPSEQDRTLYNTHAFAS